MKKIRYVKIQKNEVSGTRYEIQIKKWWGWKYAGYWQYGGTGDAVWYNYSGHTKEEVLNMLKKDLNIQRLEVEEYPMIKKYVKY
jgi:hypothetical protein